MSTRIEITRDYISKREGESDRDDRLVTAGRHLNPPDDRAQELIDLGLAVAAPLEPSKSDASKPDPSKSETPPKDGKPAA